MVSLLFTCTSVVYVTPGGTTSRWPKYCYLQYFFLNVGLTVTILKRRWKYTNMSLGLHALGDYRLLSTQTYLAGMTEMQKIGIDLSEKQKEKECITYRHS